MTFVSYAQNFEDVVLWRALGHLSEGKYLDIGAQDPVTDSVSLAFYHAGWRGIHVEPTPGYAAKLREHRRDEIVIEAAVSDRPGLIDLHEFPGTGLSTGMGKIADSHEAQGFQRRLILVPTIRLYNLLDQAGEVHWLKIDVEGMEAEVLRSWGDHAVRPWVVAVEATAPLTQIRTDKQWRKELLDRGYVEAGFDGLSRFFVHGRHDELLESFKTPPNVFDGFQLSRRHFSTAMIVQSFEEELEEVRASESSLRVASEQRDELARKLKNMIAEVQAVTEERDTARAAMADGIKQERLGFERLIVAAEEKDRLRADLAEQVRVNRELERLRLESDAEQKRQTFEQLAIIAEEKDRLRAELAEQTRAHQELLCKEIESQAEQKRLALELTAAVEGKERIRESLAEQVREADSLKHELGAERERAATISRERDSLRMSATAAAREAREAREARIAAEAEVRRLNIALREEQEAVGISGERLREAQEALNKNTRRTAILEIRAREWARREAIEREVAHAAAKDASGGLIKRYSVKRSSKLARVAMERNDWATAERVLSQLAPRVDTASVWIQLGHARRELELYSGAAAAYERAAELAPHNGEIFVWLGICHERNGDPGAALGAYRRALEQLPALALRYGELNDLERLDGR